MRATSFLFYCNLYLSVCARLAPREKLGEQGLHVRASEQRLTVACWRRRRLRRSRSAHSAGSCATRRCFTVLTVISKLHLLLMKVLGALQHQHRARKVAATTARLRDGPRSSRRSPLASPPRSRALSSGSLART